jgi:hypothetical protein
MDKTDGKYKYICLLFPVLSMVSKSIYIFSCPFCPW